MTQEALRGTWRKESKRLFLAFLLSCFLSFFPLIVDSLKGQRERVRNSMAWCVCEGEQVIPSLPPCLYIPLSTHTVDCWDSSLSPSFSIMCAHTHYVAHSLSFFFLSLPLSLFCIHTAFPLYLFVHLFDRNHFGPVLSSLGLFVFHCVGSVSPPHHHSVPQP